MQRHCAARRADTTAPDPGAKPVGVSNDAARIWVLLGRRHGDNQQMLALAAATGITFAPIQVSFTLLSALPNLLLGATRLSAQLPAGLQSGLPWPDVVITSGRRAVPLARWIRRRNGYRTRLVHVGRPWAPLSWFDLVITTPQYRLPEHGNVVHNLMPLGTAERARDAGDGPEPPALTALPRPWTAVYLGGSARPLLLDAEACTRIAHAARASVTGTGGGVAIVAGPRTPPAALATLRRILCVPHAICRWDDPDGSGRYLRRHATRFVVTDDSVAMLAELVVTGRPVQVSSLSRRPDLRLRCADWLDRLAQRHDVAARLQRALIGTGMLASVRDPGRCVTALRRGGLLGDATRATWRAGQELQGAARRVRALAVAADQPRAGSVTRTRNPPRSGEVSNTIAPS